MISINKIAKKINGSVEGDQTLYINGVGDLRNTEKNFISFLSDERYYKHFENSLSEVIIVDNKFSLDRCSKTIIRVKNPVFAYIQTLEFFSKNQTPKVGIHETALISPKAKIGKNVYIGPYVLIEDGAEIGDFSKINFSSYIGENVIIGNNSYINSNVNIHHNCIIKNNVIIESGVVVGTSGFGLTNHEGENHIIPHSGKVVINDKVWIGANCAIDRGTINDTVIGKGTKMDNLIQIAHNVKIGNHCIIAGQSAIAGSTEIGDYVTIAGQVGIIGHLKIGNKTTIASKSQVTKSLSDNSFVSGIPARDHKKNLKLTALFNKLDSLLKKNK